MVKTLVGTPDPDGESDEDVLKRLVRDSMSPPTIPAVLEPEKHVIRGASMLDAFNAVPFNGGITSKEVLWHIIDKQNELITLLLEALKNA